MNISSKSSKEQVAEFFEINFKVEKEVSNNIIKEYISGDILPNLSKDELIYLGLTSDIIEKLNDYYEKYKDKFKENEIKEEISSNSNFEEVNKFLKNYLDFKEITILMNEKMIMELNEEDMEKLGMKLGQRKRLITYIYSFNKNIKEVNITNNSSKEDISIYLKNKLKFSEKSIKILNLDGHSLFSLKYSDINELIISNLEKDKLKIFIEENDKKKYNIQPISDKSKYNEFMIIIIKENYYNELKISFKDNKDKLYKYIILDMRKKIIDKKVYELFFIQIESNNSINEFKIVLKNKEKNLNKIMCIYKFDNIHKINRFASKVNITFENSPDKIFKEFFRYFSNKTSDCYKRYNKNIIEMLFEKYKIIKLNSVDILKFVKFCSKYKFNFNFKRIEYNIIKNSFIEDEYIISDDEIDNLNNDFKIIELLTKIYLSTELLRLCKNLDNKLFPEILLFFQSLFKDTKYNSIILNSISSKDDINYVIELSNNLKLALEFIYNNYDKIIEKLKSFLSFFENIDDFKIKLDNLKINEDPDIILIFISKINYIEKLLIISPIIYLISKNYLRF